MLQGGLELRSGDPTSRQWAPAMTLAPQDLPQQLSHFEELHSIRKQDVISRSHRCLSAVVSGPGRPESGMPRC